MKSPHPPRPSQTGTSGGKTAPRSADVERALILRDVMDHAVKVQREISEPKSLGHSRRLRRIVTMLLCVPVIALCAYSWIARPEIIWGPSTRSVPAARQEADVRFALFLLAQRVEVYRAKEGVYPASLGVVGEDTPGISYTIVSDSVFELRAIERGKPIAFLSNENVDAFLGNSPALIVGHHP